MLILYVFRVTLWRYLSCLGCEVYKVKHLKNCYNSGETVYLEEHEPNIVAGVLKQFLRELILYIYCISSGLHCEGIYHISGVKSKVQHLKDCYNNGETVYLEEHEPNIVAGVLKQFLREFLC